jgi:hypothetical protein
MSPTCPVPLHSAFKGHRGGRSDNLHACDPYHTPYHTPHVAWLADNLLPAPQDQGGWGQVSNQCSPQPQPQPLSTTTSINNMTSLHANIRSVSLARPKQNTYSSDVTKFSIQQRLALRSLDEIGSIVRSSPKIQSFSLMPGNPGRASVTGSGLSKGLAR